MIIRDPAPMKGIAGRIRFFLLNPRVQAAALGLEWVSQDSGVLRATWIPCRGGQVMKELRC